VAQNQDCHLKKVKKLFRYLLSRANSIPVLFSAYAQDGGLYVPEELPVITKSMLLSWKNHSFSMICAEIMHLFTDIDLASLNEMTTRAYTSFNGGNEVLPMTEVNGVILLDASCGPTLAFKDVGQQIVAQLMNYYLSRSNRKANIMVDTSGRSIPVYYLHHYNMLLLTGDTGPAAIAAVKECPNLDITVLYPYQVRYAQHVSSFQTSISSLHTPRPKYRCITILSCLYSYTRLLTCVLISMIGWVGGL
jgi:threonine synthase